MKEELYREWQGKQVAVIGLGISNLAVIRFLTRFGAKITGRDQKNVQALGEDYQELTKLGVELILGECYLQNLSRYDVVFLSPGIPKHLPEIMALRDSKTAILSEIDLVLKYCQAPIYGVTGSSGKTTTTTLIGEMLTRSGQEAYVGGNIGTPIIEIVEDIPTTAKVVLELSSFQLEWLTASPHGALVTNITENHLDIHRTMKEYINAKKQIYKWQTPSDWVVFNADCETSLEMTEEAKAKQYLFSLTKEVKRGAFIEQGWLTYQDEQGKKPFAEVSKIALPGQHNVANILAAAIMSYRAGASWSAITEVAHSFAGVPHRLELVSEHEGVSYYNDSIATTPARTIVGLQTFAKPIILIAGGYDKQLSFTELASVIHNDCRSLIVFGQAAQKIAAATQAVGDFPIYEVKDLEEAVRLSVKLANAGDVVLLSPSCASYDQYRNFAERGEHFRRLVNKTAVLEEDVT